MVPNLLGAPWLGRRVEATRRAALHILLAGCNGWAGSKSAPACTENLLEDTDGCGSLRLSRSAEARSADDVAAFEGSGQTIMAVGMCPTVLK